jgi:hypothetical protein
MGRCKKSHTCRSRIVIKQKDSLKRATTLDAVVLVASKILTSGAFLLMTLLAGASAAQAAIVSYTLEDVFLVDGTQMTGAFDWTYTIGDFEGGSGKFTALDIPWRPNGAAPPLEQEGMVLTIENGQIEISLDGNFHDYGLDISLKFPLQPLSPTQSSLIDTNTSFYECCGNGFKDQPFSSGSISPVPIPATFSPTVSSLADTNGNNYSDVGVFRFDPNTGKNRLSVMDGGSGNNIKTVSFGSAPVRGFTTVPDATGDLIPEGAALLEGSLFARVKDVVNGTLLGKPKFNPYFDPVAFLSVGDAGGGIGPDVVVVGREAATGKVRAWVKDVADGKLVSKITFSKSYVPFDAVAIDNVLDSPAMEIAVLGIKANGRVRSEVKDALTGNLISRGFFGFAFKPLFYSAAHNSNGNLKYLAVLGRYDSGEIRAVVQRWSGSQVSNIEFSKNYDPIAFISFADSNGSGGGEIAVVGVNAAGKVRAQVKEIADGALVGVINFSASYPPLDAIAVNSVAGTGRNEIAVLGENITGQLRLQIKDLLTGDLVNKFLVP